MNLICLVVLSGVVLFLCFLCDDVADYLDNLDDEHQNDNCGNDNVVVVTLNALNVREVSEAASADCASHRGESDEVYQGDRNTAGKSRNALADVHSENDPELGAAIDCAASIRPGLTPRAPPQPDGRRTEQFLR